MLTPEQKKQIRAYFQTQPVELVYLFGSQTTKQTTPLSDYDFGILFQQNIDKSKSFDLKLEYMGQLAKILRTDKVDVVDLNQAPLTLLYSTIAPRYDIYVKSEDKRIDFEHKILSQYLDRLYYIRRHSLISLATIAKKGFSNE